MNAKEILEDENLLRALTRLDIFPASSLHHARKVLESRKEVLVEQVANPQIDNGVGMTQDTAKKDS